MEGSSRDPNDSQLRGSCAGFERLHLDMYTERPEGSSAGARSRPRARRRRFELREVGHEDAQAVIGLLFRVARYELAVVLIQMEIERVARVLVDDLQIRLVHRE